MAKENKPKKTLSQKLMRVISGVMAAIIFLICSATYQWLDLIYLAYAAIQSFFASYEIEDVYNAETGDFFAAMDTLEREYTITVEIYRNNGDFIYSSSYKGDMSYPPYDNYSYIIPSSEQKNYEVITDLGSVAGNSFNLSRDTEGSKNTDYLVGTWDTESGIMIKIFRVKSVLDTNSKIAVAFVSCITVFTFVAALFALTFFVKRITRPLGRMSTITKNMSNMDFSQKCEANDIAEIDMLSNSINEMSDSLENALVELREKNQKLQDDIEQEKTIDQLRQVFISGVSHELKTPIAIIQGYSEGLKLFLDSDIEMAKKYCDTIISETDRMNNLVMKLLDIIKYESGEYKLLYEKFIIHDVIDDWFDRNSAILREKGITAVNETDENMTGFGDPFILATVVNNYMSNAVSHAGGEMVIKASAREISDGLYRISIFNTGTPIAAKDMDQIWNSFYRADKSMSRAQGRFGLGLAIVAAIQKLHEQEYGVVNHDDGVEFWFDVGKYEE